MDSILISIAKLLGMEADYTYFNPDVIMHINTVLLSINQLGVGPPEGFSITDTTETWSSLVGDRKDIDAIKTLIYMKVKLLFDPPTSSYVLESMERQITELEWRIKVQVEKGGE